MVAEKYKVKNFVIDPKPNWTWEYLPAFVKSMTFTSPSACPLLVSKIAMPSMDWITLDRGHLPAEQPTVPAAAASDHRPISGSLVDRARASGNFSPSDLADIERGLALAHRKAPVKTSDQ